MSATLEAEMVTKIYREGAFEVPAVQDVSLSVRSGEVVAILGPSGSGKTTLLSMLGCMLRPTSGTITIHGERVSDLDESELPWVRRRYVGFIFQSFNLFAALSAAENVEVVLQLKGLERRPRRTEALRLLDLVGLGKRADFLPRDMSGGERQRVSIARALAGDPPLILADEPTANLDAKNGEQVMKMLHAVTRSDGRTVIIVTHDHRVMPYIDRSVRIEDGRLVA
ncbi:MAG TPA: ABC transporter ATP-binding protein [Methylomirabilota bacterium]|nr:ABC transporter ATP-binding protein [Methylomirabilota bacterium]